ncbi:MAG TPA: hypothetical protein VL495_04805, partial [Edaphobacter sp.]|nr:hypothetical protein [Edaphobacter sp.]
MNRARFVFAALTPVLVLAMTGCHKKRVRAYHPPPTAPATNAGRNPQPSRGSTESAGRESGPAPAPMPPNLHGKPTLVETGLASWYGPPYAGRKGADGKVYDQN